MCVVVSRAARGDAASNTAEYAVKVVKRVTKVLLHAVANRVGSERNLGPLFPWAVAYGAEAWSRHVGLGMSDGKTAFRTRRGRPYKGKSPLLLR